MENIENKELTEHEIFNKIVNYTSKNDRISWDRQYKKLEKIITEEVSPLEDKILELKMQKQVYTDQIIDIRGKLAKECVHPRKFLILKDDHVFCKFCDAKIRVNMNV